MSIKYIDGSRAVYRISLSSIGHSSCNIQRGKVKIRYLQDQSICHITLLYMSPNSPYEITSNVCIAENGQILERSVTSTYKDDMNGQYTFKIHKKVPKNLNKCNKKVKKKRFVA